MKPVFQTHFGGSSAPLEEQGNCGQAVIASLLGIDLEEAFDVRRHPDDEWQDRFQEWLRARGLGVVCIGNAGGGFEPFFPPGYAMAHTTVPNGIPHVVVTLDGIIVHDPARLPDPGPIEAFSIIYPLDIEQHGPDYLEGMYQLATGDLDGEV